MKLSKQPPVRWPRPTCSALAQIFPNPDSVLSLPLPVGSEIQNSPSTSRTCLSTCVLPPERSLCLFHSELGFKALSLLFSLHSILETPCPCCLRAGFKFSLFFLTSYSSWGFPGVSMVKNPPINAGGTGLIPGLGRSPGGGHGNPLQYAYPENSIDGGAWWATVHGVTKSWTGLRD